MADWVVYLENIVTNNDGVPIGASVIFTDQTTQKIPDTIPLLNHTLESFKALLRGRLVQYAAAGNFIEALKPGLIDTTPIADVPPDPTDDEKARAAYHVAYRIAQNVRDAVDLGIWDADDPEVVQRIDAVRKLRDAAYLDS